MLGSLSSCSVWLSWNIKDILKHSHKCMSQVFWPRAGVSCWGPSGNPFPLHIWKKALRKYSDLSALFFMCAVQLCVCYYALRQAAGCVRAGLVPAVSQEDRRGSRWICFDLTLPTPSRPPGPPLPTCTSLSRVEGRERSGCFFFWGGRGMGGKCNATSTK